MAMCLACGYSLPSDDCYAHCPNCYPLYEECVRANRMPPGFTGSPEELDYRTFVDAKMMLDEVKKKKMEADTAHNPEDAAYFQKEAEQERNKYDKYMLGVNDHLIRRKKSRSIDLAALRSSVPW